MSSWSRGFNCPKTYIGETNRPLYIRRKEHMTETEKLCNTTSYTRQMRKNSTTSDFKSAIAEHAVTNNHVIDWDGIKSLDNVQDWKMRGIKEAIHIRSHPNNMNRPQGERFILSHIWDTLLVDHQVKSSHKHGRAHDTGKPGATDSGATATRGGGRGKRGRRF